jgi:sugar O-acyltransferase (sialic acid O-acetyltransferase NeuD family)
MREPLLLIGAGGHAMACIDVIEQEGRFQIAGVVGKAHECGTDVLGYPVLGHDEDLPRLLSKTPNALITVGQIKTPEIRIRLFKQIQSLGGQLSSIFSNKAYISKHARIGVGTIIMHGAIVNAGASVGDNCIINSLALIEHDATVADHCHVATGALLNSGVRLGAGSFVGSGARVRQSIKIGECCVIGMGQVVVRDVPDASQLPPGKQRV